MKQRILKTIQKKKKISKNLKIRNDIVKESLSILESKTCCIQFILIVINLKEILLDKELREIFKKRKKN